MSRGHTVYPRYITIFRFSKNNAINEDGNIANLVFVGLYLICHDTIDYEQKKMPCFNLFYQNWNTIIMYIVSNFSNRTTLYDTFDNRYVRYFPNGTYRKSLGRKG